MSKIARGLRQFAALQGTAPWIAPGGISRGGAGAPRRDLSPAVAGSLPIGFPGRRVVASVTLVQSCPGNRPWLRFQRTPGFRPGPLRIAATIVVPRSGRQQKSRYWPILSISGNPATAFPGPAGSRTGQNGQRGDPRNRPPARAPRRPREGPQNGARTAHPIGPVPCPQNGPGLTRRAPGCIVD